MNSISFFARGEPKGQPRPKAFARNFGGKWQARVYDPGTSENWKSQIALAAMGQFTERLAGAVSLSLDFLMPRPKSHYRKSGTVLRDDAPTHHTSKPDCDNLSKAVMDALTQINVWTDDTQVAELTVTKRYADGFTGCYVTIRTIGDVNGNSRRPSPINCQTCGGRGEVQLPPTFPPRAMEFCFESCDTCGGTGKLT